MEEQEKMLSQPEAKLELPAGRKTIPPFVGIAIIVVVALLFFGAVFAYQYFFVKPQAVVQTAQVQSQTTAKINQKIIIDNISITPLEVTGDSRCTDICVWAGTVTLKVKLESQTSAQTILTLNTPYVFENKRVTLTNVFPAPSQVRPLLQTEYSFEFSVTDTTNQTAGWKTYTNTQYGFGLTFPDSWKGYTVEASSWEGRAMDNSDQKYSGPEIVFTNPQGPNNHIGNTQSCWQNIPIMIFTHDQWGPDFGNDKAGTYRPIGIIISAAPVGAAKIGENSNYVFALPPRWSGFVCDLGIQEAYNIVKTFKAIK